MADPMLTVDEWEKAVLAHNDSTPKYNVLDESLDGKMGRILARDLDKSDAIDLVKYLKRHSRPENGKFKRKLCKKN